MDTHCHPGPSLSPSTASKTPSRQADGEAAQLLPGRAGEGKDRVREVRCYTQSYSGSQPGREGLRKTEIWKEKGTQPQATKDRHRPMPTQLRYAQVHTFPIQIHHFGSIGHSQIYKHSTNTQIYTKHTQRLYKIPSIRNSEHTYSQTDRDKCSAHTNNS